MNFPHPMDDHTGFAHPDQYDCDWCGKPSLKWKLSAFGILDEFICEDCRDNYEPPDPPGWEGGFADNH